MKGLGDLMKQAQQMQSRMSELQQQVAQTEVTGESGAGMVSVVMNGRHDVKRVQIDPGLLNESVGVLEDLLAAAVNDAVRKVEAANQEQMAKLTGGLELPEGFKMPF